MAKRSEFPPVRTRYGRVVNPTPRMADYMEMMRQERMDKAIDELSDYRSPDHDGSSQWETMDSKSDKSNTSRKQILSNLEQQKLEMTNQMLRLEVQKLESELKLKELEVREKQEQLRETNLFPKSTSTPAAPGVQPRPHFGASQVLSSVKPNVNRQLHDDVMCYLPDPYKDNHLSQHAQNFDGVSQHTHNSGSVRSKSLNPDAPSFHMPSPDLKYYPSWDRSQHVPEPQPPFHADDSITRLADLLSRRQDSLPNMEPEIYSGDLLKFPAWMRSFETLIEAKTRSDTERLYYLSKYTTGSARQAVQGFLALEGQDVYARAKQTLVRRYGDKYKISDAFRTQLDNWPIIKAGDGEGLQKFSDFLQHCQTAMESITYLRSLDSAEENKKLVRKLPRYLADRWNRIVDRWLYSADTENNEYGRYVEGMYPPFSVFCNFLCDEARIACGPGNVQLPYSSDKKHEQHSGKKPQRKASSFNSQTQEPASESSQQAQGVSTGQATTGNSKNPSERMPPACVMCKGKHKTEKCYKFLKLNSDERKLFAKNNGLCYGCLRKGHLYTKCRRRNPSLLQGDETQSPDNNQQDTETAQSRSSETIDTPVSATVHRIQHTIKDDSNVTHHAMILPVTIHHKDNPGNALTTYALLDSQSSASFISKALVSDLDVGKQNEKPVALELTTMLTKGVIDSHLISGLVVKGVNEETEICLPGTYSRDSIPADRNLIPRPETVSSWPHLQKVASELSPLQNDTDIGLLIGFDCSAALLPREVAARGDHEPYGIRTPLGWSVTGPIHSTEGNMKVSPFAFKTQVKDVTMSQVKQAFDLDFCDGLGSPMSVHDKKFMSQVQDGIHKRLDGHLEMPLPLKQKEINLPNNKELAKRRLNGLKKRLLNDSAYKADYTARMQEMLTKGYAERAPADETTGRTWYIPHHGVYHPRKPDKLRVVFDCSAEHNGQSLNNQLLAGPDQINNLTGVLCRFRQDDIAFMCDVEGMFLQVGVDATDRDLLRFLWWEDEDLAKEPLEFRMTVHLFGATSSPGCANFALKTTAELYEKDFGIDASNFLKQDFYVDDGLKSVKSAEIALDLIDSTRQMCASSGFKLHKFVSNSKEVLNALPPEILAKDLQNLDITHEHLPIEHTLGVQWNVESDAFQFRVTLRDQPFTRRGILSTISSIYDPLGLVAPFLLTGKKLLQELCRSNKGWDEEIPDEIRERWEKWRQELVTLAGLQIPRCYKDPDFGTTKQVELHHFSDASLDGYGQCSYIRQIDETNKVSCALAFSKAKVAPTKTVTVPRLELTAAVLSVKVSQFLNEELDFRNVVNVYWTDSSVVLGYLANETKRFHVFVANRIQKIHDYTSIDQWNHIATNENPADCASRGQSADDMMKNDMWWKGPSFLMSDKPLPLSDAKPCLQDGDPEVKKVTTHLSSVPKMRYPSILCRLEYFSGWHRAKSAIALCIRYKDILKTRVVRRQKGKTEDPKDPSDRRAQEYIPVSVQELQLAENLIIFHLQQQSFPEECKLLRQHIGGQQDVVRQSIKRKSCLHKLDPYIAEDGLIHVGGRIRRANVPRDLAHPVILPRYSYVTRLLISHFHEKMSHAGTSTTLNEIRAAGYWITKGRAAVASSLWKCVLCRKYRGKLSNQKMADLPSDRLEDVPPFTYSAVDFFGPFYVKEGRSEKKRWGSLFTCLSSRAVHIEIAHNLTTDSFLSCYRRFVGRRGHVRELRCDRGTNFVGAKSELEAALCEMSQGQISSELLKDGCDWVSFKFNPPHASHMGGVWERLIRSVRNVLTVLLDHHGNKLDDELLRTLMVEAEAIINSRPLTYVDMSSADAAEPLTPSQLLTLRSKVVLPPPGKFVKEDLYCRKRWRRVQYIANEFWTRWRKEFLPTLQERRKWTSTHENLKEGDIVIMADENVPRNEWPRARVSEVFTDEDNLVRKVKVKTATSEYERPIHKLLLLLRPERPVEEPHST